ncbi:MAG: hypothetical protein PHP45_10150 [Elusimicrobiales bacterium]|nr:hypothetical protein [Elusimicrobiales bacterium]
MKTLISGALFALLIISCSGEVRAQQHTRATLKDAEGEDSHVRATLNGTSDGRTSGDEIIPYSPYRNTFEFQYGGYSPSPYEDPEWGNPDRFKFSSLGYFGASYLHNFTPYFGMGLGYEHFTGQRAYSDSYNDSGYSSASSEKVDFKIDTYSLLMRFALMPDKAFSPEFTISAGGFSEQDTTSGTYSYSYSYYDYYGNYYADSYSYTDTSASKTSGATASIGLGLRYHVTEWLSIGGAGKLAFFKPLANDTSVMDLSYEKGMWHWFQYGVFTGVSF